MSINQNKYLAMRPNQSNQLVLKRWRNSKLKKVYFNWIEPRTK